MEQVKKEKISFACISKYRTFLMGLAILSILVFHYTEDCVNNSHNLNTLIVNYKNYIGSGGVDVFLFLSGFGLYYSFKKKPDKKFFWKKRFWKILVPYFLVAIPAWGIKDILIFKLGFKQFIKDVLFISFFEDGNIWFWYILMIVVCYLIFPYIFEFIDGENSNNKMINIFVFITVIAIMLQLYNADFFNKINIALLRFPAFFAGCFIGKASYKSKAITIEMYILLILSFFLLLLKNTSGILLVRYIVGLFNIVCFILFAVLLEILSRKNIKLNGLRKIVEWFGDYSLELYLTHVAIRAIMLWLGFPTYRIRYECLLIVLSIVASVILKKMTTFINNKLIKA